MFFGALRSVIRPVSSTVLSPRSPFIFRITSSPSPAWIQESHLSSFLGNVGGIPESDAFYSARRRNEKNRIKHKDRAVSRSELNELKAQEREANRRKLENVKNWEDERKIEYEKMKRKAETRKHNWYWRFKPRREEEAARTMSFTHWLQWRKIQERRILEVP